MAVDVSLGLQLHRRRKAEAAMLLQLPNLRTPSRPLARPAPQSMAWAVPRGPYFQAYPTSHCGASSGQAGRSPTSVCMNYNCLWPIMRVRVAAGGDQDPDLIGPWIIYCLWLRGLI